MYSVSIKDPKIYCVEDEEGVLERRFGSRIGSAPPDFRYKPNTDTSCLPEVNTLASLIFRTKNDHYVNTFFFINMFNIKRYIL